MSARRRRWWRAARFRFGRTMTVLAAIVLAISMLATLSGCLLRPQDQPQVVPSDQSTATADPTPSAATAHPEVTVFLVHGDRLSAARRGGGPASDRLTSSLQALVRPVGAEERTAGLSSALPGGIPAPGWTGGGGGVVVGLPAGFDQLATRQQVIAIGQIVFTVTENSGAESVSFTRADAHVDVPDGTGRLLARAVTRGDYEQIAPR